MKRKRKVRWSESVGAKQWNTSRFGLEKSLLGEFALFAFCTLLFFGAACGMLQDAFEWEVLNFTMMFRVLLVTVLVGGLVEATTLLKRGFSRFVRFCIGVAGIAAFALYVWLTEAGTRIVEGLLAMTDVYLDCLNDYFGTSLGCPKGDSDEIVTALRFVMTVLCFLVVWRGRVKKQPGRPVLVPFLVTVLLLIIGRSPKGLGLFVMFVGVLLANAAGFRNPEFAEAPDKYGMQSGRLRYFSWVPTGVCILVLCLAGRLLGASAAEDAVYGGQKKVQEKQDEILEVVTGWDIWQEFDVSEAIEEAIDDYLKKKEIETRRNNREENYARLDNDKPEYNEEPIVNIALEKKPHYGMYLIGFYADEYRDGVWKTDVAVFEKACEKAGFNPEETAEQIVSLGVREIARRSGKNSVAELMIRGNTGWMYYAKANRAKTLLPYFSEVENEAVWAEGDGRYVKEKELTKLSFSVWNYDFDDLMEKALVERKSEIEEWEPWYETYVMDRYLEVPVGMNEVRKVAEEIRAMGAEYFHIVTGEKTVNMERLDWAVQVAAWMRQHTEYSLELPELPKRSDPIEFFLGTSRQGYCMHYAGASVLILRELGVPARYVSGYIIGDFEKNDINGSYEAVVRDSNGHAWVEIYLDGLGWIPIEVTKGYSVMVTPMTYFGVATGGTPTPTPEASGGRPNGGTQSPTVPNPTATPAPGATRPEGQNPSVTPGADDVGESHTGGADGPDISEEGGKKKFSFYINPVILIFVLVGLLIYPILVVPLLKVTAKYRQNMDERQIQKRMKRQGNRQRIKLLNRRLYRKLRIQRTIRKRDLCDEEYASVLMKHCMSLSREEKERYMYLVKEAAFSFNDFTKEDVEFCRKIYRKVLYEAKKNAEED